jgi:hypothetical protein
MNKLSKREARKLNPRVVGAGLQEWVRLWTELKSLRTRPLGLAWADDIGCVGMSHYALLETPRGIEAVYVTQTMIDRMEKYAR